ncbi:dihydrofolate reductase [Oceanobacillus halophilus]|uniref:Dihydrofolate reductase n=1 Tax=Oceanobacillus halophilus TaxID=930130 RepID=A0A495ACA9_9BACI|nr:dihydrofolate reductase [Oceanobacillus halophilus]RKQ37617.1 dihydrofolate reductase [Oceanobacillus halophilus]
MLSLLVAMDKNRIIGANNDLPWHLPNDLKFFKQKTTGHTIIMGRKTFQSIGRALPNRRNVVLTKSKIDFPEGVEVIHDITTVLQWNKEQPEEEFFIIGGGNIFTQILPFADRMYITWIDEEFQGETYFPVFEEEKWNLSSKIKGEKDEKNRYDYYFLQYDRK